MTGDELLERLKGFEWNDIEFKEAKWAVPKDAYETVSAFANTAGGWLVFGVSEKDKGKLEIIGVIEVDKVQNDFLGMLRDSRKIKAGVVCQPSLQPFDDKVLLIFYISEAHRQDKPIYLDNDPRRSYIRLGGRDQLCSPTELECFLREAATDRYDGHIIKDLNVDVCFDAKSIQWYRAVFARRQPDHDTATLSDIEFLQHWGLIAEQGGQLRPTRASILLFGAPAALNQIFPRPIVDCQWHQTTADDIFNEERWRDRFLGETNLVQTWQGLQKFFLQYAETPFTLEAETLQRTDLPPDYISFREAAVNLLIHQDYGDHTRLPSIHFYQDRTIFWNPGDAFATGKTILALDTTELRNPRLVAAFRRIGLSEQAGTGLRSIYRNWSQLGWVPPIINNDKAGKSFQLTLPKEPLLSETQLLFLATLGVKLSETEAVAFALACRQPRLSLLEVQAVTRLSHALAQTLLDRLVAQALLERVEAAPQPIYLLAEHLRAALPSRLENAPAATEVISPPPSHLTDLQWEIIRYCGDVPRSLTEIKTHLKREIGLPSKQFSKTTLLDPLVGSGNLQLQFPDNPNHPNQRYTLTESGLRLKLSRYKPPTEAEGVTS